MYYDWDIQKNQKLFQERGISFEQIIQSISDGNLLAVIENPSKNFPEQKVFVVQVRDYCYVVPFVENSQGIFLKTIIPSRVMTQRYLKGEE